MRVFEKFCSLTDLPIDCHKTETYGRKQYLKKSKALCKSGGSIQVIDDDIRSLTMPRTPAAYITDPRPAQSTEKMDNRKWFDPPSGIELSPHQVPKLNKYTVRSPHAQDQIFHCIINA
jgi:hypothetical protein